MKKVFTILITLILALPLVGGIILDVEAAPETPAYYVDEEPKYIDIYKSIGDYKITAYCSCDKCCGKSDGITASGTKATNGRTVAVDPNVIPYGTELLIDGHKYIAEDCGGAIKGNKIDIYFDNHSDALNYGVQYMEIYRKE